MDLRTLQQKIQERPSLDFGAVFSASIALFKKVWMQGFIVLLLTFITILPFYVILYIPMIAAGITDPELMRSNELPTAVVVGLAILLPFVLLGVMTFSLALNAAFLKICRQYDADEPNNDDYFYFLKQGRLGKVFQVSLIMLGLFFLGMLTCGIGILYLMVPFSLFPAFLAFHGELSAMDTVKASFALGNKNWFVIFGLLILVGLLAELGIVLCCVGIFFTAMLTKVPAYFMYKDGVGLEK